MEVVDSDVALVCGPWLCTALERQKGTHSSNYQQVVFHKCPSSKRRKVDKDEDKKEEVRGGVIKRRERWRLWIAMSHSCVASGCA